MTGGAAQAPTGDLSLRLVQWVNWLALAGLVAAAWLGYSGFVARSVLVGGVIANVSFLFLKRDLTRLLGGDLTAAKARFFMRYYVRLGIVVVILFLLVKFGQVHTVGLLVGLSTVLLGIGMAVIGAARRIYTTRSKEV
ncbi:MAG TPA: ATP synthase subunit I [Desulfurivibrionaceae bacterium]|nr:ATP synthase subunit I [Desulfurivibrionaceae bacterium]